MRNVLALVAQPSADLDDRLVLPGPHRQVLHVERERASEIVRYSACKVAIRAIKDSVMRDAGLWGTCTHSMGSGIIYLELFVVHRRLFILLAAPVICAGWGSRFAALKKPQEVWGHHVGGTGLRGVRCLHDRLSRLRHECARD